MGAPSESFEASKFGAVRHSLVFALPLVAIWLAPVLLFAFLFPLAQSTESQALRRAQPLTTVIGARLDDSLQAVDVEIDLLPPPNVKSRVTGIVTAVPVAVNSEVRSGMPVLAVDGVTVLAYAGSTPFFRDLRMGDEGGDVQELTTLLSSINVLSEGNRGPRYTRAVFNAVKGLQKTLGAHIDGTFRMSYVAYLPAAAVTVREVELRVGDSVVSGESIFSGLSTPLSVALTAAGSTEQISAKEGPLLLKAGDEQVELGSLNLTGEERVRAYDLLEGAAARGVVSVSRDANGMRVAFSGAMVAAANPLKVGVAPSSAVYVSENSTACLFIVTGPKTAPRYEAMEVRDSEILVGELGEVSVSSVFEGKRVVRDPLTLPEKTLNTCK